MRFLMRLGFASEAEWRRAIALKAALLDVDPAVWRRFAVAHMRNWRSFSSWPLARLSWSNDRR